MLNWHRDPDYEMRINALRSESEQIKRNAEQIESEILRVRSETEQIKSETEQLRRENKRLAEIESRLDVLLRSPDSSCQATPDIDSN